MNIEPLSWALARASSPSPTGLVMPAISPAATCANSAASLAAQPAKTPSTPTSA
jgi:hypothetical protein